MSAEKTAAEKPAVVTPEPQAINASTRAEASSAHSRINVPLNLENWKGLPEELQRELLWFHQHTLDERLQWQDVCDALNYDRSTVFRILKGTYEGSWSNVLKSIRGYRRLTEKRGAIQRNEYVQNGIAQMIWAGLDYALANNSITTIIGESRMGKSVAKMMWCENNNHGTSVNVIAPPTGGVKMFLRRIAEKVGVNRDLPIPAMYDSISRSFNKNRILIIDEAHRMLPSDARTPPGCLEIIRDLYNDGAGCAVAMIATQRFDDSIKKTQYMYEQVLGRIGMPIRLPRRLKKSDYMPIVRQYIPEPDDNLIAACDDIANHMGRLGILVETLKLASKIAHKTGGKTIIAEHFFKAVSLRRQMMGDQK
jgi:hypothetical protein